MIVQQYCRSEVQVWCGPAWSPICVSQSQRQSVGQVHSFLQALGMTLLPSSLGLLEGLVPWRCRTAVVGWEFSVSRGCQHSLVYRLLVIILPASSGGRVKSFMLRFSLIFLLPLLSSALSSVESLFRFQWEKFLYFKGLNWWYGAHLDSPG